MIILHFDLQPQFKYMNYFIYTSHHYKVMSFREKYLSREDKDASQQSTVSSLLVTVLV